MKNIIAILLLLALVACTANTDNITNTTKNETTASQTLFTVRYAGGFIAPQMAQTVFTVEGNTFTYKTMNNENATTTSRSKTLTSENLAQLQTILNNIGALQEKYTTSAAVADAGYADITIGDKHTIIDPNVDESYPKELLALRAWIDAQAQSVETEQQFTVCDHTAARGQMCIQQYDPVCAQVDNGIRCIKAPCPSYDNVTYSNACEACKDEKVYGYVKGPCDNNTTKLGGDRDAHGCIPSAGYQWCDPLQQCIRPWETNCTAIDQTCLVGNDPYMSQSGPACVTHYGAKEITAWRTCTNSSAFCNCVLAGKTTDGSGGPTPAYRCVPQEYKDFINSVAQNGTDVRAIS